MIDPESINDLGEARRAIRELLGVLEAVEKLTRRVEQLESENTRLRKENKQLREELEAVKRAGKRQAAPFSKGEPKAEKKTPGREPGHVAAQQEWALRWQQIVTQTNGSPVTPYWQTKEITWQPLSLAGYGVTTTYGLQTSTVGTGMYQGVLYTDAIPGLWVPVVEVQTVQGP